MRIIKLLLALYQSISKIELLVSGSFHNCIIHSTLKLVCWGSNSEGQLDFTQDQKTSVTDIGLGFQHSCTISNYKVVCIGWNLHHQSEPNNSIDIDLSLMFKTVKAGDTHTCAHQIGGQLQCFGSNEFGQISIPNDLLASVDLFTLGSNFTCIYALFVNNKVQVVKCFGINIFGQLNVPHQTQFPSLVSAGTSHVCFTQFNTTQVVCWGANDKGQSGASQIGQASDLSLGGDFSCAIVSQDDKAIKGKLSCWGGFMTEDNFDNLVGLTSLGTGFDHICQVINNEVIQCSGDDEFGQASLPDLLCGMND